MKDKTPTPDIELLLVEERRRTLEHSLIAEAPSVYRHVRRRERTAFCVSAASVVVLAAFNLAVGLHRQQPRVLCDGSATVALADADRMAQAFTTFTL